VITRIGAIYFKSQHMGQEKASLFEHLISYGFAIREMGGDAFAVRQSGRGRCPK
jgi:hypothetical protein